MTGPHDLPPGWQARLRRQAADMLAALPPSARPQRTRPVYVPPNMPPRSVEAPLPETAAPTAADPPYPFPATLTRDQLLALDPIVGSYVLSCSPCGDPMGIEHNAVLVRLSEVLNVPTRRWGSVILAEVARIGWHPTGPEDCPWQYVSTCPDTYVHAVEVHGL